MPRVKKEKAMQSDLELTSAPNKRYETFFAKFKECDTLPPSKWKVPHVIGHFVKLYEAKFGVKYSFKFDRAPSSSYEAYQIKRLSGALSSDPVVLKDYIDWVFESKLKDDRYTFRVIGFLVNEKFIHEFKMTTKKKTVITRTTILSPSILQILEDLGFNNVSTYGDLAFLKQAMQHSDEDADAKRYGVVFERLTEIGFDTGCLEKVR